MDQRKAGRMKLLADAMISRLWLAQLPDLAPADEPALLACDEVGPDRSVLPPGFYSRGAYLGGASAQPRIAVDNGTDLQTLYATPEDIAQGKLLAEQTCGELPWRKRHQRTRQPFRISQASAPPICSMN